MVDVMSEQAIITKWDDKDSVMWGNEPVNVGHSLHQSPLFSMETLARLIESYPREHYSLVKTGARGSSRVWR